MKNNQAFRVIVLVLLLTQASFLGMAQNASIEGRWDLTLTKDGKEFPSWLEIIHSGNHALVGRFVAIVGSARPISRINVDGAKFNFSIPPQWEDGNADLTVDGHFDGNGLSGTLTMPDGKTFIFTGTRAPSLRKQPAAWGTPVRLFNGKDLTGWMATGNTNQWIATDGILRSPRPGANIRTVQTFTDFKLHIEFRIPKGSNSGVYLRGRYEVQIMDSKGVEPSIGDFGAIYGFISPSEMAAKAAGEWQTYDITLTGRMITVVANGKTIIANQEIPGITGGAIDSKEGEAGPILLQGDHGPVEYRNIIITPMKQG